MGGCGDPGTCADFGGSTNVAEPGGESATDDQSSGIGRVVADALMVAETCGVRAEGAGLVTVATLTEAGVPATQEAGVSMRLGPATRGVLPELKNLLTRGAGDPGVTPGATGVLFGIMGGARDGPRGVTTGATFTALSGDGEALLSLEPRPTAGTHGVNELATIRGGAAGVPSRGT